MWSASEMRRKRREAGLCTECGKTPPRDGKTTCAECASKRSVIDRRMLERKKNERGEPLTDGRGGHLKKWVYVAWRGASVVKRGSSRELAEYLGMTQNEVCNYARTGTRRKCAGVLIEREAMNEKRGMRGGDRRG